MIAYALHALAMRVPEEISDVNPVPDLNKTTPTATTGQTVLALPMRQEPLVDSRYEVRDTHIFLVERGTFVSYERGTIGVVGALVIPDGNLHRLRRKFARIRPSLLKEGDEVKGRFSTSTT